MQPRPPVLTSATLGVRILHSLQRVGLAAKLFEVGAGSPVGRVALPLPHVPADDANVVAVRALAGKGEGQLPLGETSPGLPLHQRPNQGQGLLLRDPSGHVI